MILYQHALKAIVAKSTVWRSGNNQPRRAGFMIRVTAYSTVGARHCTVVVTPRIFVRSDAAVRIAKAVKGMAKEGHA
jgi:hypothetical protein